MTTLQIEHAITDLATWQAAFGKFARAREQAGVRAFVVRQPIDDPQYVVIDLEFDSPGAAEAFRDFLQAKVWSTVDSSPALAGTPMTRILQACPPAEPGR